MNRVEKLKCFCLLLTHLRVFPRPFTHGGGGGVTSAGGQSVNRGDS